MWKLIKGTGRLVVNTVNLLETGVNALNEAAEELQQSTAIWAAEEQVELQKKQIQRLGGASPRELSEAYQTLVERLEKLRRLKPGDPSINGQLGDARAHKLQQENQRNRVDEEHYPEGSLKRRLPRRDGRLHGQCEAWYPGGSKRWEAGFSQGKAHGGGVIWHPDGKQWIKYAVKTEAPHFVATLWPTDDEITMHIEGDLAKQRQLRAEVRYQGVRFGPVKFAHGEIRSSRLFFFLSSALKVMLRPRLWGGWKAKAERFESLGDETERAFAIFEEIKTLS